MAAGSRERWNSARVAPAPERAGGYAEELARVTECEPLGALGATMKSHQIYARLAEPRMFSVNLSVPRFVAALAQEALDFADQLVPFGKSRFVDHGLESFDIRPGLFVSRCRGVQSRGQKLSFGAQRADVDVRVEV